VWRVALWISCISTASLRAFFSDLMEILLWRTVPNCAAIFYKLKDNPRPRNSQLTKCRVIIYINQYNTYIETSPPSINPQHYDQAHAQEEEILTILCAECWCCWSSLLGYWVQSWTGHHSNTVYQQAGTHFANLRRMTGRMFAISLQLWSNIWEIVRQAWESSVSPSSAGQ